MRAGLFAASVSFSLALCGVAAAETFTVKAHLSGKSEVPPSLARGAGDLIGQVDTDTRLMTYRVTYKALTGPATGAGFGGVVRGDDDRRRRRGGRRRRLDNNG